MKKYLSVPATVLVLSFPLACSDDTSSEPADAAAIGDEPAGDGDQGTSDMDGTDPAGEGGGASEPSEGSGGTDGSGGSTSSGGSDASGGSTASGGMGGSAGNPPPLLNVVLDDLESYSAGANPTTFEWTKGDIVEIDATQANSGANSIIFRDDDPGESPEIQAEYEGATRGVIKASIYMVPDLAAPLEAYFTVYGESASGAFRLADYRFASDGEVHWRTTATGSWGNTTLTYALEEWVDVEIAWDMTSGSAGESWVTVGGVTVGPLALYSAAQSTVFGIKFGGTTDVSDVATFYVDDIGFTVE